MALNPKGDYYGEDEFEGNNVPVFHVIVPKARNDGGQDSDSQDSEYDFSELSYEGSGYFAILGCSGVRKMIPLVLHQIPNLASCARDSEPFWLSSIPSLQVKYSDASELSSEESDSEL